MNANSLPERTGNGTGGKLSLYCRKGLQAQAYAPPVHSRPARRRGLTSRSNESFNLVGGGGWLLTKLHLAIEIRYRPSRRALIGAMAWNQMQVQMAGPLAESDRIHAVTPAERLQQLGRLLNHLSPRGGLLCVELQGSP